MTKTKVTPEVSTDELWDRINAIKAETEYFFTEATKMNNQAAAARARKSSMRLRQLLKEYKAASLKA